MPNTVQLSFTKVVFPPTPTAWVHTYTAGSFFAVAALEGESGQDLNLLGRDIFNQIETEFFTLEEKNLDAIKQVLTLAIAHLSQSVILSFAAAYIKDTVLYVFIAGGADVLLKRDGALAGILHAEKETPHQTVHAASGFLQTNDTIFLNTSAFMQYISTDILRDLNDSLPNELADALTNRLQTVENSASASIIVKVEGILLPNTPPLASPAPVPSPSLPTLAVEQVLTQHSETNVAAHETSHTPLTKPLSSFHFPLRSTVQSFYVHIQRRVPVFRIPLKMGIGLVCAVVMLLLLVGTIAIIKIHQQQGKDQQIFQHYYTDAKNHFESALAVSKVSGNPGSQKDFQTAHDLLTQAKNKLSASSSQLKEVTALLAKIDAYIPVSSSIPQVPLSPASETDSPLLAIFTKHTDALYVSADDATLYYLTSHGIWQSDKTTALLSNTSNWQEAGGFSVYTGNIYVLDKKGGISKFINGSGVRANYFPKDVSPNLEKAISMAIDGSIYILFSDGNMTKYTKGQPDTFTLAGLDKPLTNPTRLFTNTDTTNIYVLDNGNSRIVQLSKTGAFQKQYASSLLASAKDIEVNEKEKKIFVLTSSGIQSIQMQ